MARSIKYRVQFKNIHHQTCTIDLYVNDYEGSIINLTAATNPFEYSEDDNTDTTGVPIRTQSGYVRVIDNGDCADLVAYNAFDIQVKFYVGDNLRWIGYVKPQQFNQEWTPTPRELEIPVVSPLGLLDTCKTKIEASAFPNVAAILLDALNQVYDGYTNFYICDRKPAGAYEYISDQWATNTLMSVRADNTQSEVELDDSNRDHKPEEDDATYDRKDCNSIIESLCNYYDWTLRECGTSIILDYANNHLIRIFSKEQITAIAEKAAEDVVGLPKIMEHKDNAVTDLFVGYDSANNVKSLAKGYKWANKNMKANVQTSFSPQWKDVTELSAIQTMPSAPSYTITYVAAQNKDLHFSTNTSADNKPLMYDEYLSTDITVHTHTTDAGTAYYIPKHVYSFKNAFRVNPSSTNQLIFNSLLPIPLIKNTDNFAINISANVKAHVYGNYGVERYIIIPNVGSKLSAIIMVGDYYMPVRINAYGTALSTFDWTKTYNNNCIWNIGVGPENPTSYDKYNGSAVIRNISSIEDSNYYHVSHGLTIPLPRNQNSQPLYGNLKVFLSLAQIVTDNMMYGGNSDNTIYIEDLTINICSKQTLKDSKTVRMLTSVNKNYQDELDISTDFMKRIDIGPFPYSYQSGIKITNQSVYDNGNKECALYAQPILNIYVEEKSSAASETFSYTWNNSNTADSYTYDKSVFNPINSINIGDETYVVIAHKYKAIDCQYELTLKRVTAPVTTS